MHCIYEPVSINEHCIFEPDKTLEVFLNVKSGTTKSCYYACMYKCVCVCRVSD